MSALKMAKQPRKKKDGAATGGAPNRNTAPIQVDKELARMIAVIAAHDRVNQGDVVTPILLGPIRMQYERVQNQMAADVLKNKNQSE